MAAEEQGNFCGPTELLVTTNDAIMQQHAAGNARPTKLKQLWTADVICVIALVSKFKLFQPSHSLSSDEGTKSLPLLQWISQHLLTICSKYLFKCLLIEGLELSIIRHADIFYF